MTLSTLKMDVNLAEWTCPGRFCYSKGVSRSFLYKLNGHGYVVFFRCHDPPPSPQTPQTLSTGLRDKVQIRTDVRTRYPAHELGHRTGHSDVNPSGFRRAVNSKENNFSSLKSMRWFMDELKLCNAWFPIPERSAVFLVAPAAKFCKRDMSCTSKKAFPGLFGFSY